jgi:hypothetical protein
LGESKRANLLSVSNSLPFYDYGKQDPAFWRL